MVSAHRVAERRAGGGADRREVLQAAAACAAGVSPTRSPVVGIERDLAGAEQQAARAHGVAVGPDRRRSAQRGDRSDDDRTWRRQYIALTIEWHPVATGALPWIAAMRRCAPCFFLPGLIAGASAASAAHAAIAWKKCCDSSFQCARVPVPLDPTGVTPGTVTLTVERKVAATDPTNTAVVALAGGPGQAAVPLATDLRRQPQGRSRPAGPDRVRPARDRLFGRAEVQGARGRLQRPADLAGQARESMRQGDRVQARRSSRPPQRSADIEALRVAAGYSKLVVSASPTAPRSPRSTRRPTPPTSPG